MARILVPPYSIIKNQHDNSDGHCHDNSTYPAAAVHRSLLLNKDVDVLNCIHRKKTFAGAKLYHSTTALHRQIYH